VVNFVQSWLKKEKEKGYAARLTGKHTRCRERCRFNAWHLVWRYAHSPSGKFLLFFLSFGPTSHKKEKEHMVGP
jgi:hypothetical protein